MDCLTCDSRMKEIKRLRTACRGKDLAISIASKMLSEIINSSECTLPDHLAQQAKITIDLVKESIG